MTDTAWQCGVALLLFAAMWAWNRWECLRNPRRPVVPRWYHSPWAGYRHPDEPWDLQELNRDYRPDGLPAGRP